jgi:uncharacterized protein YbjT (DUF2867 family)
MRIAVAGGTGVVGKYVVGAAQDSGHEVIVLARSRGIDLRGDAGVAEALAGVDVLIDVANSGTTNGARATAFFRDVTARLQRLGAAQGVRRLVTLSIVGIDGAPGLGYYGAKLAQEAAAKAGPLLVTIVRATQFHEFPGQILGRLHLGPLGAMPIMRIQPVAARSVGRCLLEAALDPPSAQMIELAGPQVEDLVAMARQIAKQSGRRLGILPIRVPGPAGRVMRGGTLLATPTTRLVGPTFGEWLASVDARSSA